MPASKRASYPRYIAVHDLPAIVDVSEVLCFAPGLFMLLEKAIRIIENPEVRNDRRILDEQILSAPGQIQSRQIRHRYGVVAEVDGGCPRASSAYAARRQGYIGANICHALDALHIGLVRDHAFERDPVALVVHFGPGVGDHFGGEDGYDAGGGSALETLADFGPVQAAGNAAGSEKCHKKSRFGVALSVAVGENFRGGECVGSVVAEEDLVADVVVDRADPGVNIKLLPAAR